MSFEQFLAFAADKRADVRLVPSRDEKTGGLTFVAHLHGVRNETRKFGFIESVVVTLEMERMPGDPAP